MLLVVEGSHALLRMASASRLCYRMCAESACIPVALCAHLDIGSRSASLERNAEFQVSVAQWFLILHL